MTFLKVAVFVVVIVISIGTTRAAYFTPTTSPMPTLFPIATYNTSVLYGANVTGYDSPFLLANISGPTRFSIGYAWATLLATRSIENYGFIMQAICNGDALVQGILELFLDIQFHLFATQQLPQEYQEELRGIRQAMSDAGFQTHSMITDRAVVLSSFPGDVASNIEWLLLNELGLGPHFFARRNSLQDGAKARGIHFESQVKAVLETAAKFFHRSCSHFGVWGSRTDTGELYTGRNLDWLANSGIAQNKLLTIVHPPEVGRFPHVAIAFAGMWGALTGMGASGITVHESGDDNKMETLQGFSWTLRLRYIMEMASTMSEALALWRATNNTLGINHGIGSAKSRQYVAIETKASYSAYFFDNDTREAQRIINGTQYGFPLTEAVWRTNHGYDPTWLSTAIDPKPGKDTFARYMLLHDTFLLYASQGTGAIGALEAVNLTAIVGDKGDPPTPERFTTCPAQNPGGINVLSATFLPERHKLFVAFENGLNATHTVACCNPYVEMDMTKFWGPF